MIQRNHKRPSLNDLNDSTIEYWVEKAKDFLNRQPWSWEEFSHLELLYGTAVYLYEVDRLLLRERKIPCYVVHCQEDDNRFETVSYVAALSQFKRKDKDKQRVALFHWLNAYEHKRLYASDGYAFNRDFGPQAV